VFFAYAPIAILFENAPGVARCPIAIEVLAKVVDSSKIAVLSTVASVPAPTLVPVYEPINTLKNTLRKSSRDLIVN